MITKIMVMKKSLKSTIDFQSQRKILFILDTESPNNYWLYSDLGFCGVLRKFDLIACDQLRCYDKRNSRILQISQIEEPVNVVYINQELNMVIFFLSGINTVLPVKNVRYQRIMMRIDQKSKIIDTYCTGVKTGNTSSGKFCWKKYHWSCIEDWMKLSFHFDALIHHARKIPSSIGTNEIFFCI